MWVTLFLLQLSQECSKFKVATGTLLLVSACLLQAVWPANELSQRTTPVCPCSRRLWTRSSLLDIAPAKEDWIAGGASVPTMHLSMCYRGFQSCGCIWRIIQAGSTQTTLLPAYSLNSSLFLAIRAQLWYFTFSWRDTRTLFHTFHSFLWLSFLKAFCLRLSDLNICKFKMLFWNFSNPAHRLGLA